MGEVGLAPGLSVHHRDDGIGRLREGVGAMHHHWLPPHLQLRLWLHSSLCSRKVRPDRLPLTSCAYSSDFIWQDFEQPVVDFQTASMISKDF